MNTTGVSGGSVAPTSPGHWLICRFGDRLLAVPLGCVVETMRPLPLRAFSGIPDFILGVSVIRGAVVPVIDVETIMGVAPTRPTRFVTIKLDDRTVALAVDGVLGVRTLDEAALQDVPPLLGGPERAALTAIGTLDSRLVLVLDTARLVSDDVWATLEEQVGLSEQVTSS